MDKINWDIKELKILFFSKIASSLAKTLDEYLTSLSWKHWRACYHAERSEELWEELSKVNEINFSDNKFQRIMESSAAEVEAMVQVLHSMGDILAQIVNLTILGSSRLEEDKVSLGNVIEKLNNQNIDKNVLKLLLVLKNSHQFKYINAFCNTIKHRKLLDIQYHTHIDYENNGKVEEGVRFKKFIYKGESYPVTWAYKITEEYRVKIYDMICNIGIAVNNYLK